MVTDKGNDSIKSKSKPLQWHPAFFATLQIELAKEKEKLIFENEHTLSTKPMLIDVVIVKKNAKEKIQTNIGRIYRQYNVIEYKSPTDYLGIDDFYKVYGYTCFYKSSAVKQNVIPADELTITFVCKNYPYKFVNHLKQFRGITTKQTDAGIYYLQGDYFPMQLIVTSKLSKENNLWLSSLTDDLKGYDIIDTISSEYLKHKSNKLYKSAMNIIISANKEEFKEAKPMCEAILELFKEEYEKGVAVETAKARAEGRAEGIDLGIDRGIEKGIEQGIISTINSCKSLGATREQTLSLLIENFNLSKEKAEGHMKKYW